MPTATTYDVPFGAMLRAWRLCYAHSWTHGCFIRVQDRPNNCWAVEIVPLDIKHLKRGEGEYRIMDGRSDADKLMSMSPALRDIRNPRKPTTLLLDDSGNRVE